MKKIYKSLTVSAIVATVSLSALPQSLAITHESQPTKQQRTVLFDRSHGQTAGAADWVSDGAFSDYADSIQKQGYDVKAIGWSFEHNRSKFEKFQNICNS